MIESPCNKICINNNDDICIGCGRTLSEIAVWISFTDEEKIECIKESSKRLKKITDV